MFLLLFVFVGVFVEVEFCFQFLQIANFGLK